MRNTFFILLFFFHPFLYCQNLVPNYSFEQYDTCPNSYSKICNAIPWFQPNISKGNIRNSSSTDYFHTCTLQNTYVDVPQNTFGFQYPNTGNGYAGISVYYISTNNNYREYLEVELSDTLEQDKKYFAEFYISLADSSNWAAADIGVYFSNDSLLDSSAWKPLPLIPQINNFSGNLLDDKINWTKISGTYTALGGEKFMTIGNFKDDDNTYKKYLFYPAWSKSLAYYYIDDVSVSLANCIDSCIRPSAKYSYEATELTAEFNNMSSAEATHWFWNFGDGNMDTAKNPVHVYDSSGTYSVTFIACYRGGCYNSEWCCDTITGQAAVSGVGVKDFRIQDSGFRIYPNPAGDKISFADKFSGNISIINIVGQKVYSGKFEKELDVSFLPEGIYIVELVTGQKIFRTKFIKE